MKRTLSIIALLSLALLGYGQLSGRGEDQAFKAITIKDGPVTIHLNSKDFIELTDSRFPGRTTQITPIGIRVSDGSGRSQVATQFVDVEDSSGNVLAQLVQAVSGETRGLLSVANPSTGHTATIDPDLGFTQIKSTSGYTGTLAEAIAAGKSFVGGVLVN